LDVFEPETIAAIAADFADLLEAAVTHPDRRLLTFDLPTHGRLRADRQAAATSVRGFPERARTAT
jgi:hypothetical protein